MSYGDLMGAAGAILGGGLFLYRLWPRTKRRKATVASPSLASQNSLPLVSIIVPARNEEATLGRLLQSLAKLDYPAYEVLVVDDRSQDATPEIARSFAVTLIEGQPLPSALWGGKQWACMQGAAQARGNLLLFTDADTWHDATSLRQLVSAMEREGLAMASALPFHAGEAWWERLSGPFHLLLLAIASPYRRHPAPGAVYAIGQYLAFTKQAYDALGGHAAVHTAVAEDLALADRCLSMGLAYAVLPQHGLYQVRMYPSLPAFVQGWRRNIRAGLQQSRLSAGLEASLMVAAFLSGGHLWLWWLTALMMVSCAALQPRHGRFSIWGALLLPFSLGLFCWVSAVAVSDQVLRRQIIWKGRARFGAPP